MINNTQLMVQKLIYQKSQHVSEPHIDEIRHLLVDLPQPNAPHKTKTVVFDMDQTLINFVTHREIGAAFGEQKPDAIVTVQYSDYPRPVQLGFNIRPYALECLKLANKHFQVIVFTASDQEYADAILDYLDPNHELI